jgi:hypothetical protein
LSRIIKNIFAGGFVILLFILGYLRETIFLVINSVLKDYPFPYNRSYITPPAFLYDYNESSLLMLKWTLTFVFSALFAVLTLLFIHFYFNNKVYNKITLRIYIMLVGVSLLLSLIGMAFNTFDETYAVSRFVIGLAQYPLIPLILFVLFYFKQTIEKDLE